MLDPTPIPDSARRGTDSLLFERMAAGDQTALDTLLDCYWSQLVAYAGGLTGSWDSAQDLTQEAFVRLWERRESWDPKGSVQALLYRIVRNLALDLQKSREREEARARRVAETAPAPTPLDVTASREFEEAFGEAVKLLSPRRREVYELVRVEGLSYREVGEMLEISTQTVANHLTAAVSFLRDQLSVHLMPDGAAGIDRVQGSGGG